MPRPDDHWPVLGSLENQGGAWAGPVSVWQMNHADLKTTHTFGDDQKVRPKTSTVTLSGGQYTFPAHSLTILRFEVK